MAVNNLISVHCFNMEIGRLGFDDNKGISFFQYHEQFLANNQYIRIFPLLFKRTRLTQVFNRYNNETFRGLPPMIADSLPDLFGNIIFKTWMETLNRDIKEISVLEQLAYVGIRAMGALEFQPAKAVSSTDTINLKEVSQVIKQILEHKSTVVEKKMDHQSLINIFKIGSSAGGMRPKILVSESKLTGQIIPGDIVIDDSYNHYLIKLGLEDNTNFSRELVEYSYFQAARNVGIDMMDSKMIDGKHFATIRFDRQNSKKIHTLTATGISGLDYKDPNLSSYENLFDLLKYLKCPHKDIEQLYRRMVFNLVFANHDDHLKNQSVIYDDARDKWNLAPAYDLTYSLNPELNIKTISRALSINGKRKDIEFTDFKKIAEKYTVKNYKGILEEVMENIVFWEKSALELGISSKTVKAIRKNFTSLT